MAPAGPPAILVGNECCGMAGAAPLPMRALPVPGLQPAGPAAQPLVAARATILGDLGIGRGGRVGIVGWKTVRDTPGLEVPAFLVDELRRLTGPTGAVENATDLLIDAGDGLRAINEIDQLAAMEYAACRTSQGVRDLIARLRPGHDRKRGGPRSSTGTACPCPAT